MKHIADLAVKKRLDRIASIRGYKRLTSDTPKRGFMYHKKKKIYFERDTPFRKRLLKDFKDKSLIYGLK